MILHQVVDHPGRTVRLFYPSQREAGPLIYREMKLVIAISRAIEAVVAVRVCVELPARLCERKPSSAGLWPVWRIETTLPEQKTSDLTCIVRQACSKSSVRDKSSSYAPVELSNSLVPNFSTMAILLFVPRVTTSGTTTPPMRNCDQV